MSQYIDAAAFHRALLQGARRVEGKREELNRINAFPVPDRDTGNNLAYLMAQLRARLAVTPDIGELLTDLGEASLLGARGNSGAIFSQYFEGFRAAAIQVGAHLQLRADDLARLFRQGYTSAYQAIQQPREGTVLSAMASFADGFEHVLGQLDDWRAAADSALTLLKDTVMDTVNTLPQQRALGAPDAGAMGFLYFAEGFVRSLLGQTEEADAGDALPALYTLAESTHAPDGELTYRFCTEAVVRLPHQMGLPDALRQALETMGDSMVLSQAGHLVRVHLHTNEPAKAIDLLAGQGALMETKADDMHMQQALTRQYTGKTALVVDSIADVPQELLGEHAYVLPLTMLADGVSYQDRRTISPERVKALSGYLSSSQLNLAEVKQFLDPILHSYDRVLILSVSSRMSGLFARYEEYLRDVAPGRVHLVDTRRNSAAQGLLALHAARRLTEGADVQDIARELAGRRDRTHILVNLPDLDAMIASGRLKPRIGKLLRLAHYLPLINIDKNGEGGVTGLAFSRARGERLMINRVVRARPQEYAVVHFDSPGRALSVARALTKATGSKPTYVSDISSVVANFAGPGACAVAWVAPEDAR